MALRNDNGFTPMSYTDKSSYPYDLMMKQYSGEFNDVTGPYLRKHYTSKTVDPNSTISYIAKARLSLGMFSEYVLFLLSIGLIVLA